MDWFLYDNGLRHERVNKNQICEYSNQFALLNWTGTGNLRTNHLTKIKQYLKDFYSKYKKIRRNRANSFKDI